MRLPAFVRPPGRPAWRPLGAASILGCGVGIGQVPISIWPIALLALGGLLAMAARSRHASQAAWLFLVAGIGHTFVAMYWITDPFFVEPDVYGWMAPFALGLMGIGFGAFWALAAWCGWHLSRSAGGRLWILALMLAVMDVVRSYVFTGFPWVLFGHIWIGTPVAQIASVTGQFGLSVASLACAAALGVVMRRSAGWRWVVPAGAAILGVGAWMWGDARIAPPRYAPDPVHVRLVQPNAEQRLKWVPEYRARFFKRHLDLTAAPSDKPLDLVIWPETSVPFLLDYPGDGLEQITAAAHGVPVAFGVQRSEGRRYYNSLAVIGADARITALYDKVHLVPFGEYIPLGDLFARVGIRAFAAQEGAGYSAGTAEAVLDLGQAGRVQPLICYEAVFPQDIRRAPQRPDWIMQITNDAWFGTLSGPRQHLSLSQLRAIEFGLPLARAANTGITAMIDPYGQLIEYVPLGQIGTLDVDVPQALAPTFYARWGDMPVVMVILSLLGISGIRRRFGIDRPRSEV
ncbi:apolipoprotein N-acyltransferase [Rhodobacteraceae bacterium]|nr:apolipoprotein N-acyltransferase [Paracoccaceae bacterium]